MLRHGTSTATDETGWSGLRPVGDAGPDLISETWNVDVARCVHLDYGPTSRHRLRGLVTPELCPGALQVEMTITVRRGSCAVALLQQHLGAATEDFHDWSRQLLHHLWRPTPQPASVEDAT